MELNYRFGPQRTAAAPDIFLIQFFLNNRDGKYVRFQSGTAQNNFDSFQRNSYPFQNTLQILLTQLRNKS